ncbi:hypothetical protein O1611_g2643 [Lasiodiplodia mahajangana]|uniref:Uncharacterized protein n=1 Tax=Lasiodiplodia mahajangana TaxID=1108764 RepID=A0ACC2JTY8_9PEZI|nr:hypothetical protein O1611_g2643 [Lasiodiplodia mahajangana]
MRRLWVAAAWRTPWRGASPLSFPIDAAGFPSLKALCDTCKLPQIYNLPLELLRIIQSYSEHALLWRGALAFELAACISCQTLSSLSTLPLKDIIFWERGKQPQVTSSLPPLPLIRIVVDAAGVSKIERVSVNPYKGECSSSRVYIVEREQAISEYKAQFKDGFLRLKLASSSSPAIWNTANPPALQLCRAYEIESLTQYQRFFTVELAGIRGITFFFSLHQLYSLHIHRSSTLCALPSLQRVPPRRCKSISWCYLPIAKRDRIVVLGVRISPNGSLNLLVRMKKAGDVIVGPYIPSPAEDLCLGWHAPITLVHREPEEGRPIPYLGAYCQPPTGNELPNRFQFHKPNSYPLGEDAYLSMAPLGDIRTVAAERSDNVAFTWTHQDSLRSRRGYASVWTPFVGITILDIEKTLLLQWADRVRLLQPGNYDNRLDESVINNAVSRILSAIRLLLSQSTDLQQRYGMEQIESTSTTVIPAMSSPRLRQFLNDFERLSLRIDVRQKEASIKQRLRWVVKDREKFRDLIHQLSNLVAKLDAVIPASAGHVETMTRHDIRMLRNLREVQLVLEASKSHKTAMALWAQDNIIERCQERVLDRLWFRKIDDRRNNIMDPHAHTFEWALHPPAPDVTWDDLSGWLRSGSDIYWVSGKAGSGKSTLMKYLYQHEETKALLEEWAKGKSLVVANFFFWHLGAPEQRTLEGLCRALLYYILNSDQTLIPKLLPDMWREAHQSDNNNISIPSIGEMTQAFLALRHEHHMHKFCFFIDGLDEYDGNLSEGIQFINNLASNSEVKVLVSSRPVSACFQAYSRKLKIQLQDLTRDDIKKYVDDILGGHPYVHDMLVVNASNITKIFADIVTKASGVFLWVVLACRSILQGLDAYDYPAELQRRVDELPPELERLFTHMLNKIEPRYRKQAAKLLRICYQRRMNPESEIHTRPGIGPNISTTVEGIYTLGLALLDECEFDLTLSVGLIRLKTNEKIMKCKVLEERLRSRCCGLLEVYYANSRSDRCFCGFSRHHRHRGLDRVVDSVVGFMHRSVFEFLNNPHVWDLDCLQINDNNFEPNAALARMYLHLAYSLSDMPDGENVPQINELTTESLICTKYIDNTASDAATSALHYVATTTCGIIQLLNDRVEMEVEKEEFPFFATVGKSFGPSTKAESHLAVSLAVELGMINVTRQWKGLSASEGPDLLYHALDKPFTSWLPYCGLDISPQIIEFLLFHGYSPNATIKDDSHHETTPWRRWLVSLPSISNLESRFIIATVMELFLKAGANLNLPTRIPDEKIEDVIRRKLLERSQHTRGTHGRAKRHKAGISFRKEEAKAGRRRNPRRGEGFLSVKEKKKAALIQK